MTINKAGLQSAIQSNARIQNATATQTLLFGPNAGATLAVLAYENPNAQGRQLVNLDLRKGARPFQVTLSDATLAAIAADVKASLAKTISDDTASLKAAGIDISS